MKKTVVRVIAALLAVVLLFALGFFLLPLTETVRRIPVKGSADWMKKLPDDLLLSDILIPGTHDSATRYVQLPWFSKCQDLSIAEQLEAGYRYLDIRLGDAEKGADYPPLMHGFTKCKTGPFGAAQERSQRLDRGGLCHPAACAEDLRGKLLLLRQLYIRKLPLTRYCRSNNCHAFRLPRKGREKRHFNHLINAALQSSVYGHFIAALIKQ